MPHLQSSPLALRLVLAAASVFLARTLLCLITGTSSPLVVVTSQSMSPTFERGDLLLLWNRTQVIQLGEIPVVWFPGEPLPMVHRAISVTIHETRSEHGPPRYGSRLISTCRASYANTLCLCRRQMILTKGDYNLLDDKTLQMYPSGQDGVFREQVIGIVSGYVPYIGTIALMLKENAWLWRSVCLLTLVAALVP